MVGSERQLRQPSGAPALRAASYITRTVSEMQRTALGCGLMTMAFRPLRAINALKTAVEVGLVQGIIAATTPAATAISTIPFCESSRITPTVLRSLMALWTSRALNRVF